MDSCWQEDERGACRGPSDHFDLPLGAACSRSSTRKPTECSSSRFALSRPGIVKLTSNSWWLFGKSLRPDPLSNITATIGLVYLEEDTGRLWWER